MIWVILYLLVAFVVFCWLAYEGEEIGDCWVVLVWPLLAIVVPTLWVHDKLYHLGRKHRNKL